MNKPDTSGGSSGALPTTVRIADPGQMVAAIPHLLGFHPQRSLVLCVLGDPGAKQLRLTVRADLPAPTDYQALAEHLLHAVLRNAGQAVIVAIVDDTASASTLGGDASLPRASLVQTVRTVFGAAGVDVAHALWLDEIRTGQRWQCYDHPDCADVLPDLRSTQVAAATVASGGSTVSSRQALVASLDPVDEHAVARRAVMLDERRPEPRNSAQHVEDIQAAVDAVDTPPVHDQGLTDQQVVGLARALADPLVRDTFMYLASEADRVRAERLWTLLVRHTPAPWRAEPACMLASAAYLRGDGALAAIALDIVEAANPRHELGGLLRSVLDRAMAPEQLIDAMRRASEEAQQRIRIQP